MSKIAFISGITGQDGSYLSELLIKKKYEVHGVKRRSSSINTKRVDHIYQDPHLKKRNFILHYGDVTDSSSVSEIVNKIKQEVLLDDKVVALSTAELEALMLFVDNANAPLSRDFLVENLRGIEWQTCDRSVDVLVSRLRNKLGENPSRTRFIKTVHGVGYRFVGVKK